MKKVYLSIGLSILVNIIQAQSLTIKITGTKFPFEIMQQWIDVYKQSHPNINFQLSKTIPTDSVDLLIAAHSFRPGELNDDQTIIAVNRYAQLPIVNSNRSDLKALQQKGFTKEDLQKVYFTQNEANFHVYRRNKNVCASRSFAENATGKQLDVAGTLVNGDDRTLANAVKSDVNGISYNNLGLIYNLKTRKVADSIAIIPINLNKNEKIDANENIYGSLDNLLTYLSETKDKNVPQDDVNIVINKNIISKEATAFLSWIILQGQQYNRSYGFLSLDKAVVEKEQQQLNFFLQEQAVGK